MLAVRGKRLFDGDRTVEGAAVLIEGDRIVDVGVDPPEDATIVDLGDATLLPGLIDCHQHLCFDGVGTLEEQVVGVDDTDLVARARANARRALDGGVTTLRDLGDRGYLTLALRDDPTLPAIVASGPPITLVQGHCWYLGGECPSDDHLRRAVDERADRGCDVVKVMVSGGALTPTYPLWKSQFSVDQLRLIVDGAHRRSLPVAAHCHGIESIEHALDAGADSIEHCTFMNTEERCDPPEALIARIANSGVVVSSTVGRLPGAILNPLIAANQDAILASRRRLLELGATIVAGTDAGIAPSKPHDVLPWAFDDLLLAGMSPIDGLRALTSVAARAVGLGDRKGRLATGYDADIVAVSGDPLADPAALRAIAAVWHAGVRHSAQT